MNGLGRSWQTGFWVFLVAYFCFHAFNGDSSVSTLRALQLQEQDLLADAKIVHDRLEFLNAQTQALSGSTLDPDVLEEQVRNRLGFTHPDEVVIFTE
jgi:cell division protein FtsB